MVHLAKSFIMVRTGPRFEAVNHRHHTSCVIFRTMHFISTGLELARLADLPSQVIIEAKRVAELLKEREEERKTIGTSSRVAMRRKAILTVGLSSILVDSDLCLAPSRALIPSTNHILGHSRLLLTLMTDRACELVLTLFALDSSRPSSGKS
jgi:hypothetical protein